MSMNEDLLNQIVRRILADPALQGLLQSAGNSLSSQAMNQALKGEALVLLNYVPDFPRVLPLIQQRWGKEYRLSILPSDQVYSLKPELPPGLSWISQQEAMGRSDWQSVIIPACSANMLAKVALGIRDNPLSEMAGRQIAAGKAVEIVTESWGLSAQTPQAYRALYEGYVKTVQSYGVKVSVSLAEVTPVPVQAPAKAVPAAQPSPAPHSLVSEPPSVLNAETVYERYAKKFLGDKQAWGFPEDSTILVTSETVISPLARDTLKQRRIKLYVEKEGGQR